MTLTPEQRAAFDWIHSTGARIDYEDGDTFAYDPSEDRIIVPPPGTGIDAHKYELVTKDDRMNFWLSRVFHELVHWTGTRGQTLRPWVGMGNKEGSRAEAIEEIIAESGAVLLSLAFGLKYPLENSAGYVAHFAHAFPKGERANVVEAGTRWAIDAVRMLNSIAPIPGLNKTKH